MDTAAFFGQKEIAEVLLRYGADPSIRKEDGKTALDLAVEKEHTAVAKLLQKYTKKVQS
jgi:ankyrin repeat protein